MNDKKYIKTSQRSFERVTEGAKIPSFFLVLKKPNMIVFVQKKILVTVFGRGTNFLPLRYLENVLYASSTAFFHLVEF